jgi:hypothetical protein
VTYEKPTVTKLGSLAEFTLYYTGNKSWGGFDGIVWHGIDIPIHTVS